MCQRYCLNPEHSCPTTHVVDRKSFRLIIYAIFILTNVLFLCSCHDATVIHQQENASKEHLGSRALDGNRTF